MKKIAIAASILFFASLTTNAQTSIVEYNYVTKGYKNHLDDGSDMKKGYELQDISSAKINSSDGKVRKGWLKSFRKLEGAQSKVVAYMIVYQLDNNEKAYICVPHPSSDMEIVGKYLAELHDGSSDSSHKLQLISFLLTKGFNW